MMPMLKMVQTCRHHVVLDLQILGSCEAEAQCCGLLEGVFHSGIKKAALVDSVIIKLQLTIYSVQLGVVFCA